MTPEQRLEASDALDAVLEAKGLDREVFNNKNAYMDFARYELAVEAIAIVLAAARGERTPSTTSVEAGYDRGL